MKKITLILLLVSMLLLLFSCNKDEKFPTKKDLKGHWVHCEGWCVSKELIFNNKTVELIFCYEDTVCSKTCNYRLDITIKKIYFTSGVLEGKICKIWIEKKTGLLYIEDTYRFTDDDIAPAVYKKISKL